MKIKLADIVNNASSKTNEDGTIKEESLFVQLQEVKFPVKVSYRIKRLISKLEPILKAYNEKRNELVKEFGEIQEDKTLKVSDPEKLKLFYEKINELLTTEEEVEFEAIKVEELGDIEVPAKLLINFVFE
jgi:hypothetical protein